MMCDEFWCVATAYESHEASGRKILASQPGRVQLGARAAAVFLRRIAAQTTSDYHRLVRACLLLRKPSILLLLLGRAQRTHCCKLPSAQRCSFGSVQYSSLRTTQYCAA